MGDGINDAPALKAADVGISVDNAVDIAKESADVILLEKNLMVLEEGVLEGRKVFANILKYIRMGASSNFGNMFSVIGASAWLPYVRWRQSRCSPTICYMPFHKCQFRPTTSAHRQSLDRDPGTSGRYRRS